MYIVHISAYMYISNLQIDLTFLIKHLHFDRCRAVFLNIQMENNIIIFLKSHRN